MFKPQSSSEGKQRDDKKGSNGREQSKISGSSGRMVRPLSEVLFHRPKKQAINEQQSADPMLKNAIID